jgi:mercuric ion transport protein
MATERSTSWPTRANTDVESASSEPRTRVEHLTAIGGILGAIAASSCCVVPLLFVSLGVSGAWIGNLTALAPYQPYILGLTVAVLGYGFYSVYWRPRQVCSDGTCEQPLPHRAVKVGLWLGIILVAVALIFPRIALLLASA